MSRPNVPTQGRYPPELRERAVRMVKEATVESGGARHGVVTRIAIQLGIGSESLRPWVKQAEVDVGQRPGVTSEERQRIAELEREVRELRRANEILKSASADWVIGPADQRWLQALLERLLAPRISLGDM
ncbi:MAG: transposase [Candidatus Dormibacteraeota bacterium]|uniref:Transposase n=2 Tax=Candidatus Dormibacteria TaxID=3126996 RepID=A0A934N2I5_9BACT|nr:transposase [Candidatus Dormibacteraeota bacterium]MBJ7601609.1 transposase [Candidatus Dormibacteraeota bacterium]MBJ7605547.1 transposase [Candidatus Dormibacteraeota bacterium]